MEQYAVWEGFMADLEKKVATIRKKCAKYGCEFHFAKVGEEIREVEDHTRIDPTTGKPLMVKCKFIICEAEGTAQVNGWEFVAAVEHTEKGNIFHKAMTDVAIPMRYRTSDTYCEHCKTRRERKGTCLVMNTETGEFKQVGDNCLKDFTHGMSASWAAYMASLKTIFKEIEEKPVSGWGWRERYYDTREFLQYTAETIRLFGFAKSDSSTSTRGRVQDFFDVDHGNTFYWLPDEVRRVRNLMESVGFNPDSTEAKQMVEDALTWLDGQEANNDYLHNLKVAVSLDDTTSSNFGLLVSLFPTWDRELETEAQRKADAEAGKTSKHVGKVGDRLTIEIESIKCLTSWESCYDGYHTTTTYLWKIVGKDGNVYTWKTSHWLNEDKAPAEIKGTVKEHKTFRDVKQTDITRCKVTKGG